MKRTLIDWLAADIGPTFVAGPDWMAVVSAACAIQDVELAVNPVPVVVEVAPRWEVPVIPGLPVATDHNTVTPISRK